MFLYSELVLYVVANFDSIASPSWQYYIEIVYAEPRINQMLAKNMS